MAAAPAMSGALVGCTTVYATMPFDNIKTRLQATDGRARYHASVHCFVQYASPQEFEPSGTVQYLDWLG